MIRVLLGPTAVGKTEVGLEVAERLGGEIISADARQVYRGLVVGSAQPDSAARQRVPHHLVDCVDPLSLYTAADFGRDARRALESIEERGRPVVIVGGSGLYVRALLEGLFAGPGRDDALRRSLAELAEREGNAALHARLAEVDPQAAARLHANDRVRVVRALEVAHLTGVPLSEHHRRQAPGELAGRARTVVLGRAAGDLEERIARRAEAMFAGGLLDEARDLLARGLTADHPVFRTVGYEQAFAHLAGTIDLAGAIDATRRATRQYARRQLIWFRALSGARWVQLQPHEPELAAASRALEAWGT